MKILLQSPRDEHEAWRAALSAALPAATIVAWPNTLAAPDYALVFKPPPELFAGTRPNVQSSTLAQESMPCSAFPRCRTAFR
jgi:hypothetical protein